MRLTDTSIARLWVVLSLAIAGQLPGQLHAFAQGGAAADTGTPARFSHGAEVTATFAGEDNGFYNYTDYEDSLVRLLTGTFVGALRIHDRVAVLGEVQLRNRHVHASALYARVRPWRNGPVAVQIGRVPPTFGRFSRRGYGRDNPLVGLPLAYQYLTTLRSTAVPVGTDALLAVRGRGWLVSYPTAVVAAGAAAADAGLPLITSVRWDTGVQVNVAHRRLDSSIAFTNGSLSNPRVGDDNSGKQVVGRLVWQPAPIANLGVSVARAAFLSRHVTTALPPGLSNGNFVQMAAGVDGEVSADHWVVRGEVIRSQWRLPALGTPPVEVVASTAATLETVYRFGPRWQAAVRGEQLLFSQVESTRLRRSLPWDAPVSRIEVGVGYAVSRHIAVKTAWQYNWRDGVARPIPREGFLAVQVAAWY